MKTFLFILMLVWFVFGASAANDRGFFDAGKNHDCDFVGSELLTIVAGPINYVGVHPKAYC